MLQTLIDNLPDFIYAKDKESRFILNNITHTHLLGADSPQDLVGKSDFDFFPEEFAKKYYNDEQKIIATGHPLINEAERYVSKNGDICWVATTKVPIRDTHGDIIGLVGMSRDVTERILAEQITQATLEQRSKEIRFSTQLAQDIAATTDLDILYQRIVTQIQQQFGYYHTQLLTHDADTQKLKLVAGYGEIGQARLGQELHINFGKGLIGLGRINRSISFEA